MQKGIPLVDTRWTRIIDIIIYPIGTISLLMTLPQAYEIWILGNVEGVSMMTWTAWTIISIFWVLYGIAHNARALVFMHSGWFLMNGLVALGLLMNA